MQDIYEDSIDELLREFYLDSQIIIESNLLHPYSSVKKANLKNGIIERELHGAMHATRVVLHTVMLHKLFSRLSSEITDKAIALAAEYLNISQFKLLLCLRYAAIFHDYARQGEGNDEWEAESAESCAKFLLNKGYAAKIADLIRAIIQHKDDKYKFDEYLASIAIPQTLFQEFDYLRILLNLADCFDIIGRTGNFNFEHVTNTLKKFYHFNSNLLIEYARQLHAIVYEQGDMFFACEIILEDGTKVQTQYQDAHYSLANKVRYEHGENVLILMANAMRQNNFFRKLLEDEPQFSARFASVEPAHKYYIHGTSSLFFADYAKTGKMQAAVDMLNEFNRAPLDGEIIRGGHNGLMKCNPLCFGRLGTIDDYGMYSLKHIMENYAIKRNYSRSNFRDNVRSYLKQLPLDGYNSLNIFRIYIARAKQLGYSKEELITEAELHKITTDIEDIIQIITLTLFMGKYIFSKVTGRKYGSYKDFQELRDAIRTYHAQSDVIRRIRESKLDLTALYANPTPSNLQKVLDLLAVSQEITINSGYNNEKAIHLTDSQWFTLNQMNIVEESDQADDQGYLISKLPLGDSDNGIGQFLALKCLRVMAREDHRAREVFANKYIESFRQQLCSLHKLLSYTSENYAYTPQQLLFIENAFPIILMSDYDYIGCCSFHNMEFRCDRPLKLGQEINMIAVTNLNHQLMVMKYLSEQKIQHVSVILFDELAKSNEDFSKPKSIFTHTDGMPKLAWLAAQAHVSKFQTRTLDKGADILLDAAEIYGKLS